jgi:cytidine deaminase
MLDRLSFVNRWLKLAISVAQAGVHRRYRVGAVLVAGNRVLSQGVNGVKSHPWMCGKSTIHAEVSCLVKRRYFDVPGQTMFVARISKRTGRVGMARPCKKCQDVLKKHGITDVYFTDDRGLPDYISLR